MPTADRIVQLRVQGLRVLRDVTLDLGGLTVLIGENGVGKSSILEALEMLRLASLPNDFISDVVAAHGGLDLLRRGATELRLGARIEGDGLIADYDLRIKVVGTGLEVLSEVVSVPSHGRLLLRAGNDVRVLRGDIDALGEERETAAFQVPASTLALPFLRTHAIAPGLSRTVAALGAIETHYPFETRPLWQQTALEIRKGPRAPAVTRDTDAVGRYGVDLPNAFLKLRNRGGEAWQRVVDRARLGIGEGLRDITTEPVGQALEVALRFADAPDKPVRAWQLSEGQVAYLAFVAVVELNEKRSILTFDEPELHLHPGLISRVAWMFEEAAGQCPIVLATHSDRLLDALEDPAKSVVLCQLDESGSTELLRPDAARLASWLADYRGLGDVRANGYEKEIFVKPTAAE